jgi:integrase
MADKRSTRPTLFGTRIYVRRGFFHYFSPEPVSDPKTGRLKKWHKLVPLAAGETQARFALDALLNRVKPVSGEGDFPVFFQQWRKYQQSRRDIKAPKDPARLRIWQHGSKTLESVYNMIENGFADMDLEDIRPTDVALFLDQWEGRRSAQTYRSHLSKFFKWCGKKGLRDTNPATADILELEPPEKRNVYVTDEQYHKVRRALLTGKDGKPTRSGPMIQCYLDLTYLLFQRTTDVRLLRRDQIDEEKGLMYFKPTKTEKTSGATVNVQMGPAILHVLSRLKGLAKMRSIYLIHTEHGQVYGATGIRSAWNRACIRAGVTGITVKDIRSKAATDARKRGYTLEQLKTHMAHSDTATTEDYLHDKETPTSEVTMTLPPEPKQDTRSDDI